MQLAERLCADKGAYSEAWNFGPSADEARPVSWLVESLAKAWTSKVERTFVRGECAHDESKFLRLDSSKARSRLGWRPRLELERALHWTAEWYEAFSLGERSGRLVRSQIERYEAMEAWALAAATTAP
jgi:CDP-glucose 4,6-dehydratase